MLVQVVKYIIFVKQGSKFRGVVIRKLESVLKLKPEYIIKRVFYYIRF